MDGSMDGMADGRMVGWNGRLMDGWMDGRMDGGQIGWWVDGWTAGHQFMENKLFTVIILC